jgi:hypothetical protein
MKSSQKRMRMHKAPQVEPISNLQRTYTDLLRKLDNGPVFLAQRGNLAAAIVSIKEWDRMADELARLHRVVEAQRQLASIRAGNYEVFDISQAPTA